MIYEAADIALRHIDDWAASVFKVGLEVDVDGHLIVLDPWHVALAMGVIHARETNLPSDAVAKGWKELLGGRHRRLGTWTGKIGQWIKRRMGGRTDEIPQYLNPDNTVWEAPGWLTPREQRAWKAATERAGQYVTNISDRGREKVRDLVVVAVERGYTKEQLAKSLSRAWMDSARDWERVAATELQGAYNEATLVHSVDLYGKAARIARVPERDACHRCMDLFIGGDGLPRIWTPGGIAANGTNIGRKSKDWKGTLWPVHPRCRCGTVLVPPGMGFDASWKLVKL